MNLVFRKCNLGCWHLGIKDKKKKLTRSEKKIVSYWFGFYSENFKYNDESVKDMLRSFYEYIENKKVMEARGLSKTFEKIQIK